MAGARAMVQTLIRRNGGPGPGATGSGAMSTRSRKRAPGRFAPEYEDYVETRFLATPRKPASDASFLTGLILAR